jgi:hypothetical protein
MALWNLGSAFDYGNRSMIEEELEQPQQGAPGYQSPESGMIGYEGGVERVIDSPEDSQLDILEALKAATPKWIEQPQRGAEGYKPPVGPPAPTQPAFAGNKTDYQAPFPEAVNEISTTVTPPEALLQTEYAFQLELKKVDQKLAQITAILNYGEINLTPPDGMDSTNEFDITIDVSDSPNENMVVFAQITFDPNTLDITDRAIEWEDVDAVPDSSITDEKGILITKIGDITWGFDGKGNIIDAAVHNTHCGDINVGFNYGEVNGFPALFFTQQLDDPIPLPI